MDPTPTTVKVSMLPDTVICTGLVTPIPLVNPFCDVVTPETLSCLENNVVPVTVVIPANVETPVTLRFP